MGAYKHLIKPAILKLVEESHGAYRCERDLHHHFTLCLQAVKPLALGTRDPVVVMEHPSRAAYGSGRLGNLDYFFPADGSRRDYGGTQGTAVELNFNYPDFMKVRKDVLKLTDPGSAYPEAVYFAYGDKPRFFDGVKQGIESAFRDFTDVDASFLLPVGLHLVVVERRRGEHEIHTASITKPCAPDQLEWQSTKLQFEHDGSHIQVPQAMRSEPIETGLIYLTREEAQRQLDARLNAAGIPLDSITARCMFMATQDSRGQNRCKFGRTPLWDNELRVIAGRVLRSEFLDLVQRLCDSGQAHQRAARASWS